MKMCCFIWAAWLVLVAATGGPVLAASPDAMNALTLGDDTQIKGFRVPNYDDQSIMTSQIFGEFARVLPDGNVEITNLRLEFYSYEGDEKIIDMTVTSPMCYFNRANGVAISDSDVRISRDDLVVTGRGFVFHNGRQELKILNDSKVVLKGASKKSSKLGDVAHE